MVAFLQQLLTHGGYYDENLEFIHIERIQVGAARRVDVGGCNRASHAVVHDVCSTTMCVVLPACLPACFPRACACGDGIRVCMLCANTITVPPSSPQIIGSMSPGSVGRHPLSTRFTARVRVACMTYPAAEHLQPDGAEGVFVMGEVACCWHVTGVGALLSTHLPASSPMIVISTCLSIRFLAPHRAGGGISLTQGRGGRGPKKPYLHP